MGEERTAVILEERASEVVIDWGVKVVAFYDPPHIHREGAPPPVKRWRVRLPGWFPTGSWLHYKHSFLSLSDALSALDETGTVDAIDAYWHAKAAERAARHAAFGKIMAAHGRRDGTYLG